MRWYHFSSVFSLCFFTTDSEGNYMLSPCFLHYLLLMLPFIPICIDLISCFSHLGLHSDKLVVLRVFTFWAVPVFHSLDLFQLTCLFTLTSSSFLFQLHTHLFYIFLVLNLWSSGFSHIESHLIYINLSSFFLQHSWNNTRVILLPIFIFMSLLSLLRINSDLIFIVFSSV